MNERELLHHANRILENYRQVGDAEESTDHAVVCAREIRALLATIALRESDLDDARKALEAFEEYDGCPDLWSELLRQRDEARNAAKLMHNDNCPWTKQQCEKRWKWLTETTP